MNGFIALMESTNDQATVVLQLAIRAAGCAALLALAVLAVNLLLRRWLSASLLGLLWGLVLVRLCLPMAPSSVVSLQNLTAGIGSEGESIDATPVPSVADTAGGQVVSGPSYAAPAGAAAPIATRQFDPLVWFLEHLPLVWAVVAVVGFAGTTVRHARFARRVRRSRTCDDISLVALWRACSREAGVGAEIPIRICESVAQPAIMGLWQAQLLLPPDVLELDREQLRMIMLHELAHVRRWDVAQNWALVALRSIHWWNPIFWLAAGRFQNLREQACDAFVVRRLDGPCRRAYSELLLQFAQRMPADRRWRVRLPAPLLGFLSGFFRRRALRNRLMSLRKAVATPGRRQVVGAVALFALAAAAGLTDASMPVADDESNSVDWLPPAAVTRANDWHTAAPRDLGPRETRSYDIGPALARIAEEFPTLDAARDAMRDYHLAAILNLELQGGAKVTVVEPETKDDKGSVPAPSISLIGSELTVVAPASVHAELERNLAAWTQSGLGQISIATRFITSDKDLASPLGISWQYLEAFAAGDGGGSTIEKTEGAIAVRATSAVQDYLPMAVTIIDAKQTERIVNAAQGDRRSNVLQAPKVTLFNGQRASILDCTQTPFVVGVRETAEGTRQPRIAVIEEGIRIAMRATHTADRSQSRLEGRIEMSAIGEVRTAATKLQGELAAIQIPRVVRWSIDVNGQVCDGQSVLVGCIPSYEKKRFLYVLLTPMTVSPSPNER